MGEREADTLALVRTRSDLLAALEDCRLDPREIVERLDASRATVNRAVRALSEAGLVERANGTYELTALGQLALEHRRIYCRRWEDVHDAATLLSEFPSGEPRLTPEVFYDSSVVRPPESTPYLPADRLSETFRDADRLRAASPVLPTAEQFRLLYEHVVTEGNEAELIVPASLRSELAKQFPSRFPGLLAADGFRLLVGEAPPVGIALTESGGDDCAHLIAFDEANNTVGVICNDTEAAIRWGTERYRRCRAEASVVTDETQLVRGASTAGSAGASVPVALHREGFVRLSDRFFARRRAADPTTAWRTGLEFAEVHTGYAVERFDEEDRPLTTRLVGALRGGTAQLVVGPPGSGKSTVLKQVACEWYHRDLGPVFYREGGAGQTFDSVEALVETLQSARGTALVVVEDVVRPESEATFEALARLSTRDDVVFLCDAREREYRRWSTERQFDAEALAVVSMPPLTAADYDRFEEHVERTTETSIDVSADRLHEELSGPGEDSGPVAPNELLLLLHRLSNAADPLSEEPTTVEAEAGAVYDELAAAGDPVLAVGVLVNLLNAAGVVVRPAYCRAVAGEEAVETAVEHLSGRVIFGRTDERYRTVHETWSAAFLDHLLDDDERASDRAVRSLETVLALADHPERRAALSEGTDEWAEWIATGPAGWVAEIVSAVFTLLRDRPKLAPLLADSDGPRVALPTTCQTDTRHRVTLLAGRGLLAGGRYESADDVFASLVETGGETAFEAALGRSEAARRRGQFDTATEHAERAAELAGDPVATARAQTALAKVDRRRGAYDDAVDRAETACETFRSHGSRSGEAESRRVLGDVARERSDYDQAIDQYERALAIERELGSRIGEAALLNALGVVAIERGEYERATDRVRHSLDLRREIGDRPGIAECLNELGNVARNRGELETAERRFRRSLEIREAIDDRAGQAETLSNLGTASLTQGRYEQAQTRYEQALARQRELDDVEGMARTLHNLGVVAERRDDYEQARAYYRQAIEHNQQLGNERNEAGNRHGLGYIAAQQGEYDAAETHYERSREISRAIGDEHGRARALDHLAGIAMKRGNYERARELGEESLALERECGHEIGTAHTLTTLGETDTRSGDTDRAVERLEEAGEIYDSAGEQWGSAVVALSLGRTALADDRLEEAADRATTAAAVFTEIGATIWTARSDRLLGRVAAARGDTTAARHRLAVAIETFEAIGATPETIETLRAFVQVLSDGSRRKELCSWGIELLGEIDADRPADRTYFNTASSEPRSP